MKKIVSLMVFFALLVWTWNVIHSTAAVGLETHTAIQEKIAELIKQNLQAKKPQSENLEITQLWTENLDGGKIRAHYTFRFQEKLASEDKADQSIQGEATLIRLVSEDPSVDNWKLLEIKTVNDEVIYHDGSTISANDTESPDGTPTPLPSPTPAASAHE